MSNKISITIITLNEEQNIKNAILSANLVADEVIVVDSGSKDETVKIAKDLGAKVYEKKFKDFATQKNYAASKVTNDWIFSLDADEEISNDLAEEIKGAVKDTSFKGFLVPRRNFILGGEIKHSRWSPDKHVWLWRKEFGVWEGQVHEEVIINGSIGSLEHGKLHYQDKTIGEFVESMNRYTQFEAEALYLKGKRFTIFRFLYEPFKSFVGRYIYKSGFLDGWRGFALCSLRAIYHAITWLKVLELSRK